MATKATKIGFMKCKSGIWVEAEKMNVPCGQCMPCRINRGRQWSARIIMEWLFCPERSWFFTFTYSEDNLPSGGSLDKKRTLQWLKDVQKRKTGPFRYYLVGEYGDDTHRPHLHMAVFPEHAAQIIALENSWEKGFVQRAEITHARARYLANYTAKKLTKPGHPDLAGREPEFRTSSRNPPLGAAFVERYAAHPGFIRFAKERGDVQRNFRVDGKIYPIGDWALSKLRQKLGIPQTHKGRAKAHPRYEEYFPLEGAEWDPEEAEILEVKLATKKKQGRYRGPGTKV